MTRRLFKIIIALPIILLATGCETQRDKDLAAIERAVASMKRLPVPRTPGQGAVIDISTPKGRLLIATWGATKNAKGEWVCQGPSRTEGFFILPRAIWVADIAEAERLLLEDYAKGNLLTETQAVTTRPAS